MQHLQQPIGGSVSSKMADDKKSPRNKGCRRDNSRLDPCHTVIALPPFLKEEAPR
jgi:hypothetical protein